MKRHIKKLSVLLCASLIISCSKEEKKQPELPQISQPATASEFYMYNYWIIGAGFTYAENYIKTNNNRLRATNDKCAADIADKLDKEIGESSDALLKSQQNAIKVITQHVKQEDLLAANEYYKTTSIGRYIASNAGTTEMGRVLATSQYKKDIAKSLADSSLSADDKLEIVIGYMLKLLPESETLAYTSFRNLPIWDKLEAARPELQEAMTPYTDNSKDIAALNAELLKCPSMAATAQAQQK